VIGDDGLVYTSRNSTAEPLYAILATTPSTISTPGQIQIADINVAGELKKSAELVPFSFDHSWNAQDDEYTDNENNTPFADDIIFGGLGSDFLHGGSGDDAISGAEALAHAYVPVYAELGLVLRKDSAWQDQTGAPADPQAGNIPGGQRDVLRSADFTGNQTQGFFVDTGMWAATNGRYEVSPAVAGGDAVSVFYVDSFIPSYFEMLATVNFCRDRTGARRHKRRARRV
jgi:hypothetical protein